MSRFSRPLHITHVYFKELFQLKDDNKIQVWKRLEDYVGTGDLVKNMDGTPAHGKFNLSRFIIVHVVNGVIVKKGWF